MNYRPVLVTAAALAVVVAGAFALLPFQAAEHETSVEGATGRAVAGNATAELDRPVAVYVEGPTWVSSAVGHYLVGDLRAAGVDATQVERLQDTDGPLLAVRVLDLDAPYRPVSPSASARWRFVYATSGNATTVRDQLETEHGPVVTSDSERFVLEGQFSIRDDVRGVVSIPQYRAEIAERIAAHTASEVLGADG